MTGRAGRRGIVLKSMREIDLMRTANAHTAEILALLCENAKPGASTWDLDQLARDEIKKRPVKSAFLGFYGYPATICASINEVIVHGIPNKKDILKEGDIIGLDFGLSYQGYVGDTARTVAVGKVTPEAQKLIDVTSYALEAALAQCAVGVRLSDLGALIESFANRECYGLVRDFCGHGIGLRMHEEPQVLNYYDGPKPRMRHGLVIAIEPMFNMGSPGVKVLEDEWTAVTDDNSLSAHFEHSIAILEDGCQVLSRI
jgi:methionyl aminopeptidase